MNSYKELCKNAYTSEKYIEHIAGDTSGFRYPHLSKWERCFIYDEKRQIFMFKGTENGLKEIASEDITTYEFVVPEARKLHLSDMLSCPYTEKDKQIAMNAVYETYKNRKEIFDKAETKTIMVKDFPIKTGYEYIKEIYADYMDTPINIVFMDNAEFPFGSILKGTNIIITNKNQYNLGQDILHMLFHLKEGIKGQNGDNMSVKEIWAPVPELYALQLTKGRMARRIRLSPSPHPIHFTDYIYLRAYLGQAFLPDGNTDKPHPVYSFIEPAIQLIFKALENLEEYDRNRILSDAVLLDRTEELTNRFNDYFGKESFTDIFDQYTLYDKYKLVGKYILEKEVQRIMFPRKLILDTGINKDVIYEHWRKAVYENTIVLPTSII